MAWSAPDRPKPNQTYLIRSPTRADFPKPPQAVVALVPNVNSVGKHRGAATVKPIHAWDAAVAGRQKTLAFTPRKFPLCSANSYPVMQAVGLAVQVWSTGPVAQALVAIELEANFPLSGRSTESTPMRLVHHRDDPISIPNRLVSGDLLHSESLKTR